MCVCYLNQMQITSFWPNSKLQMASFVALAWAGPKVQTSSLNPAQANVVAAKGVAAQDCYNVRNTNTHQHNRPIESLHPNEQKLQ